MMGNTAPLSLRTHFARDFADAILNQEKKNYTIAGKGQVNLKVKILTGAVERSSKYGIPSSSVDVVENLTFSIKTMYFPTSMSSKITPENFCLIRNCVVGDFIRASEKSMVMACGPFAFDQKVEEDFLKPPVVGIAEAKASPQKRRLSLSGTLISSSDILTTETSRRKIIKLSNVENEEFDVKLWGPESAISLPARGAHVLVSCVTITQFNGKKEANSTTCLTVSEIAEEITFRGIVDAISIDGDESSIIFDEEDTVFNIQTRELQKVFNTLQFIPNIRVKGLRKGTKVLELHTVAEDSE